MPGMSHGGGGAAGEKKAMPKEGQPTPQGGHSQHQPGGQPSPQAKPEDHSQHQMKQAPQAKPKAEDHSQHQPPKKQE